MALSSSTLSELRLRRSGVQLPVFIGAACVGLSVLNWTLLSGLDYGPFYGVFMDPPSTGFSADGPNYYQSLNLWYLMITLCFAAYIAFSRRSEIDGFILRVAALCLAIYPFFNMLSFKYDVIVNSGRLDYRWLQNSIYVDVFCLASIVVLMTIEIMHVLRSPK